MIDEPHLWLEWMANRREYVRSQLAGGTPVLGASIDEGILLVGVGSGQSKVFEIFDRHALAGLGHPADLERVRQSLIDAAHLEGFTRAPEDVSLRRLVSYGLGPLLKNALEQVTGAPFLTELLLAELGSRATTDVLARVHFDGTFQLRQGGVAVVDADMDRATRWEDWLQGRVHPSMSRGEAYRELMGAWRGMRDGVEPGAVAAAGGSEATDSKGAVIEVGWLDRGRARRARFRRLDPARELS